MRRDEGTALGREKVNDAGCERIIKDILHEGTVYWTNNNSSGTFPNLYAPIHISTIYPNGLITLDFAYGDLVASSTTRYTKHYYAGSQRIASKIGTSNIIGKFDCNWLIIPIGGTMPPINPVTVSNNILQTAIQNNLTIMQQNNITPPPNYGQNAGYNGNCVNNFTGLKEQQMFWFHPDHLGSSSYITGVDSEVTQNIEYFPSGEVFVENHNKSNYTPYKFNGKELDAETGYYYYGARYYNPRVSLWLNVDPLADYNRRFSTSNNATSRISAYAEINLDKFSMKTYAGTTHSDWMGTEFSSATSPTNVASSYADNGRKTQNYYLHIYGKNKALLWGLASPDIDANVTMEVSNIMKGQSFDIEGKVYGDKFPSNETFITDTKGNSLFLGVSGADGSPFTSLAGDNDRPMSSFRFKVLLNKDDTFKGVNYRGKNYNLSQWNAQFEKLKPQDGNTQSGKSAK